MTAKKLKLTHPGKMLREEFMEPVGLSAYALAKALDVPLPRVNQFVRRFIQARLKINQPGNVHEQEADRVADEVMRMPEPVVHDISYGSSQTIHRKCTECASAGGPCRSCAGSNIVQLNQQVAHIKGIGSAGQRLPESERAFFEPRFGYDFSRVRVHTGRRRRSQPRP
jgi:hypothetical protein